MRKVLVVGAGSPLGLDIAARLVRADWDVTASYRTERPGLRDRIAAAGGDPQQLELSDRRRLKALLEPCDAAVFVPILTVSAPAARLLRPDQRATFFSSNNVAVVPEAPVYRALAEAEAHVRRAHPAAAILRPTMIYGHPEDGNLARLLRAVRRWPVLPRPAGSALQPVFWRDLSAAAAAAVNDGGSDGATRAVAGPEIVTTGQLFRAACRAAGRKRLILPVPAGLTLAGLAAMRRLGLTPPATPEQVNRAVLDKTALGPAVLLGATPIAEGLGDLARALDRSGW